MKKMKYRNSSFFFEDEEENVYGVHFSFTPKSGKGRGEESVLFTENDKLIDSMNVVRGNHNKTRALLFLKDFLDEPEGQNLCSTGGNYGPIGDYTGSEIYG